jgi:hypothetical protein
MKGSQVGERAVEDRRGNHTNDASNWSDVEGRRRSAAAWTTAWPWAAGTVVIALAALFWVGFFHREGSQPASTQMPLAQVTVSKPLVRDVNTRIGLLGQFSAVDRGTALDDGCFRMCRYVCISESNIGYIIWTAFLLCPKNLWDYLVHSHTT